MKKLIEIVRKWAIVDRIYSGIQTWFTSSDFFSNNRRYSRFHKRYKVNNKTILYEASGGIGVVGSPAALFKSLSMDKAYKDYKHVWAIRTKSEVEHLREEYAHHKNVEFIIRGRKPFKQLYLKTLASAKYLINDTTFPLFFSKKKEQTYIHTGIGTTVEKIGFHSANGIRTNANLFKNILLSDYLVAASPFMTNIYKKAFKLDGFYNGRIIEEGNPSSDTFFEVSYEQIVERLNKIKISVDPSKKIILYAPTWNSKSLKNSAVSGRQSNITNKLFENVSSEKYQVLIKLHPSVYRELTNAEKKSGRFIPASFDTYSLLAITDILISDFSNITFDYLITGKPVLFYVPDTTNSTVAPDLYFSPDELPGPVSNDIEKIAGWINHIDQINISYHEKYAKMRSKLCICEDSGVSKRIIDCIFHNNPFTRKLIDISKTEKIRILMNGGRLRLNGVSTSLARLLEHIDYSKYDITLIVPKKDVFFQINKHVRTIYKLSIFHGTRAEEAVWETVRKNGYTKNTKLLQQMFTRELTRLVGSSEFDYAVDYSGYGIFFPLLFYYLPNVKKRFIWQHNDLKYDMDNVEKNNQEGYGNIKQNISAAISIYHLMDFIVSVGPSAMTANRANFSTPETYGKFVYAQPLTSAKTISSLSKTAPILIWDDQSYFCDADFHSTDDLPTTSPAVVIPFPSVKNINFVTLGRLSAEKNQAMLIDAFARLTVEYPDARLYIIGDGAQRDLLTHKIKNLGLSGKVFLTGFMVNPYGLMSNCQCFVLPSKYEGMCMTVVEARILNLPIIMTNFNSVTDVSIPHGQLVVDIDENSIYHGMKKYIENTSGLDYDFDAETYNKNALDQFEALFNE